MDLVVVTGWTGAGKSTIANAIAASLDATAVSFDWVMSGLRVFPELWAGIELPVERQRSVGFTTGLAQSKGKPYPMSTYLLPLLRG
jgi:predicted kinase